ncbi:UTRA domain-containing protein [Microbispora sp. NPDC004025]
MRVAGGEEIALPDTGPSGLYRRLSERGYRIARFVEEIEARHPSVEEAEFLKLTEAQQVLEVTRIAYTTEDIAAETVFNIFPSQQWRLSYEWTAG